MPDETRDRPRVPAPYEGRDEALAGDYLYPRYGYYGYSSAAESDGPNWRHMLALLWQRKWWIMLVLIVGTGVGYLVSRMVEPLYQAYTTVWVEDVGADGSGAIRPDEVLQGAGWAGIFSSYAVILPVAEELGLYLTPLEPKDTPPSLFAELELRDNLVPGVYEYRADASNGWTLERVGSGVIERGAADEMVGEAAGFAWNPPGALRTSRHPIRFRLSTPREAAWDVWDRLSVNYNLQSSLITARLIWPDPQKAAEILNALSSEFVEIATDLKSRKLREEVAILEEQTEYVGEALEQAELALESHRISTITLPAESNVAPVPSGQGLRDPVFGAYFDKRLQADQLANDIRQIEQMTSQLRSGAEPNAISLRMIPSLSQASSVGQAVEELQRKEVERRTLLYAYTEEWPQVQELGEEIHTLRQQTLPALLREAAAQLREQLSVVSEQVEDQASQLRQIPSRSIEEARRRRETSLHAQLYNDLKIRLNNARLAEATAELADMHVVDEAFPPKSPSENEAPRIILLALLGSLGIGIAGVLLHDRLDPRIRHPKEVTGTLGLPVLGVVPRLKLNGEKKVTVAGAAMAIEAFRGIRTQLSRSGGEGGTRITLVTSPAPGEGKSTVAANLAISYAAAGQRTVLVDADTRRGKAHQMFKLERTPGLTDCLLGRASVEQTCRPTTVRSLWLLPRGGARNFTVDRLDSQEMDAVMSELEERFDVCVIDAPPLAAGADALLLGERAHNCILVVRSGSTEGPLARAKLEMIGNVEMRIAGAVLNAVPENAPYYTHYVNYYYADKEIS